MDTNNAPSRRPPREVLATLVATGAPIREIASELEAKPGTVRHWIDLYGLPRPIDVRRREVAQALESGKRELLRKCSKHGETVFALVGSDRRPRCKECRSEAVARRRRRVKGILAGERGGACLLCGYDRCLAALQFHHRDRTLKGFGIAARGLTRSIAEVRDEVDKCVLLCSNCHAEVEAGLVEVPLEFE